MFYDYLNSILFAAIIAGSFYPLLTHFETKYSFSKSLAATIVCLIILLVLIIPSIYIIVRLSQEILNFYQNTKQIFTEENINKFFFEDHSYTVVLKKIFEFLNLEYNRSTIEDLIVNSLKSVSLFLFNQINSMVGNVFSFLFQFIMMLIGIFVFLLEGENLKKFFFDLLPLRDEDEELILLQFNKMNYITLVFNGIGGIIQGVLAAVGFWIVGIQSLLLWTVLMILLAFIPLLGISLIYIPACIYLLIMGKYFYAAFLFIYCTLVALLTENWFKPAFMGKHVEMNSLLVFFSIIGGMSVFGMAGIFYGPLVISLFLTMAKLYKRKYQTLLQK
jgi:predicted PurR-regulated permease PerM